MSSFARSGGVGVLAGLRAEAVFIAWTACGYLLLAGLMFFFLRQDYRDVEAAARRSADNLTQLLAQDIESDLRLIDLALKGVVGEVASPHAPIASKLDVWLQRVRSHHPILGILHVADAQGDAVISPGVAPVMRVNVADREYFVRLRDDPQAGLQISDPLIGRTSGKTVMVLARRLENAAGRFAGVVIGAAPEDYFAEKLSRLSMGPKDTILVMSPGWRPLVSHAGDVSAAGVAVDQGGAFAEALKRDPEVGRYDMAAAQGDGIERMFSYRRNPAYGFYVSTGLSRTDAFADWRREATVISLSVLFFVLVATLLSWHLRRSWREKVAVAAHLRQVNALFDAASRAARFGGWSLEIPSMRLKWTDETYRIHEMQPGTPVRMEESIAFFAPESRPLIADAMRAAIDHGRPWDLDLQLVTATGRQVWVRAVGQVDQEDGRAVRVFGALMDIDDAKAAEIQLATNERRLRLLAEHAAAYIYELSRDGTITYANKVHEGLTRDQVIGSSLCSWFPPELRQQVAEALDLSVGAGHEQRLEYSIPGPAGDLRDYEARFIPVTRHGQTELVVLTASEISERKGFERRMLRSSQRAEALLRLGTLSGNLPERDYLHEGLQVAEALTGSRIGFLHFVNEDQETIELVTWTDGALKECTAAYDAHYPISRSGIWADCFHRRGPVVVNDYRAADEKKGLPDGHAHLERLISVPVIEDGRVRMIMGVGNKSDDYDDYDMQTVQLIGNDLWRIVRRLRAEKSLNERLVELTAINRQLDQAQNQLLQSEKVTTQVPRAPEW